MEAALGLAALENFEQDLKKRRVLGKLYAQALSGFGQSGDLRPNHSLMFFPILLLKGCRDKLLRYLRARKIESREAMPLINQPVFKSLYKPGSCPNAETWTANGLLLPLHPLMTQKDVERVCDAVKGFFN